MFLTSAEPSWLSSCKDSKTFETDVNMSTFSTLSVLTEATIAEYKISIQIIFDHNLLFRNFKWNVVSNIYCKALTQSEWNQMLCTGEMILFDIKGDPGLLPTVIQPISTTEYQW